MPLYFPSHALILPIWHLNSPPLRPNASLTSSSPNSVHRSTAPMRNGACRACPSGTATSRSSNGAPRTSASPGVIMKPEGSVKIAVMNGSRQVDQVVNGEWLTMKVLPEAGLPKGIHQLSDAKDASKNVHPHKHVGQVLHDDGRNVYQFSEGGIVKHSRGIFEKPPVVGKNYEIAYSRGQGKVIGEVSQEQAAKAEQKRSRSI